MQGKVRVGWITDRGLPRRWHHRWYMPLSDAGVMRFTNLVREMRAREPLMENELYRSGVRYDVLVVLKCVNDEVRAVAERAKEQGTKLVFDANVNYYSIWGDFPVPATRPAPWQQKNAITLTSAATIVVADSSYIAAECRKYQNRVVHIPDNVNLTFFPQTRRHQSSRKITLVWSGISQKAYHLSLIEPVLQRAAPWVRLWLVSNNQIYPDCVRRIASFLEVRHFRFSLKRYAEILTHSDVIISPKVLNNSYELGHSEYKITLGMAAGLPALASPQQSYLEAVDHRGGGFICETDIHWQEGLERLIADAELRGHLGSEARKTTEERYSSPVVARQYCEVLRGCAGLDRLRL
jgi:glycosyltransferase involved in cell wall biosynthesis